MSRFFVSREQIGTDSITVTDGDYNHIKNVLRKKVGEELELCDGEGTDYRCAIEKYDTHCCYLKILSRTDATTELPVDLILYQGLPKKDKMELIIQKSVELGVHSIVPVMCERTIVKLEDKNREERKIERFRIISETAAKQCGRGIVPDVEMPVSFRDAVLKAEQNNEYLIVPYENALGMKATEEAFSEGLKHGKIAVMIGPEGGFDPAEIEFAKEHNAHIISLGRRILRTETAGLTVLSALMLLTEYREERE